MKRLDPARTSVLLGPERWTVIAPGFVPKRLPRMRPGKPGAARIAWSKKHFHTRPFREILLVVRGTEWFGMDGTMYPFRPGGLFLIDPQVPHDNLYPKTPETLEHIWLTMFGEYVFVNWQRVRNGQRRRLYKRLAILRSEKLGLVLQAFPSPRVSLATPGDVTRMRLLVGLIAAYLETQIAAGRGQPKPHRGSTLQKDVVSAICHHIDETGGKGMTLDVLAQFSGYSKFHLHRLFRAQAGCTVHRYIDMARDRRMRALREEGATNAVISDALGFANPSAFLRWRRKRRETKLR